MLPVIIVLAVWVFVGFIIAARMSELAEMKGYSRNEAPVFALCFFFGIFGCLYVVGLPDRRLLEQNERRNLLLERLVRDQYQDYDEDCDETRDENCDAGYQESEE